MVVSTSNLVETVTARCASRDALSRSVVNYSGSRNMADIQLIQCKNQQKTSSYRRNIVPYKEIGIKEWNDDVRTLTGSSQMAVPAHVQ